jgi:hypothetical protein
MEKREPLVFDVASEKVLKNKSPKIPDVDMVIDRRSTRVHSDSFPVQRFQFLEFRG